MRIALTVAAASACLPPPSPAGPPARADFAEICAGFTDSYDCGVAIEQHQLDRGIRGVDRRGRRLTIGSRAGPLVFENVVADDVRGVWFTYREYLREIGYHLVQHHFNAGHAFSMVDEITGQEYLLDALPVFSPDGQRFVTTSEDLLAQNNPTAIQVWRVFFDGLELEWTHEPVGDPPELGPGAWGPAHPRWIDAREIRIQQMQWVEATDTVVPGGDIVLRLVEGEWRLEPETTFDSGGG